MAWNGLDTGGVELLWDDERLLLVLEIMNKHKPFSYGDANSPIFTELGESDPDTTWIGTDSKEGVRSIFRRANPLMKLGLISGDAQSASLTATGEDVLSGEMSLADLYQTVARGFRENDHSRPFAEISHTARLFPNHEFTTEDIEFAVALSDGTKADLATQLDQLKAQPIRFKSQSRPRRLRRIMRTLVSANVLIETEKGWKLASAERAAFVCGTGIENVDSNAENITFSDLRALADTLPASKGQTFATNEIAQGKRSIPTFGASAFQNMDNSLRALLLERAHGAHETLVEKCADVIRESGGTPIEGPSSFDVGCIDKFKLLIEAKYINSRNAISQFRKATAQLPEYRWRHQSDFGPNALQIIAVNDDPTPLAGADYVQYIREDRKLEIIWLHEQELINPDGRTLTEILNLVH